MRSKQSTAINTLKKRKSEYDDIDRALYLWSIEHRSQNEVINGPILKENQSRLLHLWVIINGLAQMVGSAYANYDIKLLIECYRVNQIPSTLIMSKLI